MVSGLQTLLGRIVVEAAREDLAVRPTNAYAFRREASLHRALMPLLLAADWAREWGDQMVVATLDVKAAFPSVPLSWA